MLVRFPGSRLRSATAAARAGFGSSSASLLNSGTAATRAGLENLFQGG